MKMKSLACATSELKSRQQDSLQAIVEKHISDPALRELSSSQTSTERGLQRWEQAHLVSALDVINEYQRTRKARLFAMGSHGPSMRKSFKNDARTRMCELLKSWLRANAGSSILSEDDVRSVSGLCRDLMNHPDLFPAKNPRSFLMSMADVYDHLEWQLQEVLEKDRSCADLAQRVLSLSRNLVSDTLAYLLLAPTDLQQTDALPSLEVVKLWQSLPDEGHPVPKRKDPSLQKKMSEAWGTHVGSMVAVLLRTPWCVRLFANAEAEQHSTRHSGALMLSDDVARSSDEALHARMEEARADFSNGRYKNSALAGALRGSEKETEREDLLQALLAVFDVSYLLGEVMIHFHRISDGLGDYGMIRVAPWLHPFLEALVEKVQLLKRHLVSLNDTLDTAYVLGRARGQSVQKPAPSARMCSRARASIERALIGRNCHADQLVQIVDELRVRSSPERLPHVAKGLGDACMTLQDVLGSTEFRAHVGDAFPDLPALGSLATGTVDSAVASRAIADTTPRQTRFAALPDKPTVSIEVSIEEVEDPEAIDESLSAASTTPKRRASACKESCLSGDSGSMSCCSSSRPASPLVRRPFTEPSIRGAWFRTDVHCLVGSAGSFRKHGSRSLEVHDGALLLFDKGSCDSVEFKIELPGGVDRVWLRSDTILEMSVSRTPPGVSHADGVKEHKDYVFEFQTADAANAFCEELLQQGVGR
eukprot:TRINITY_DN16096_c0_g3_i1.p1 TRINITY_DN16096_c0_g3~~TRINITY_DN16096_c0_g3_i1.p1  ORF type:complete len:706 (+),score=140.58 TRINITY_DN16096_c0_g3_i1:93-2210(+)